ncbi:hypothetical protein GQ43DRAFT_119152 [Delitschia confertaspora ATCC 74209]|uniref:Zn(2)-C6 fungal-type domain-containing protein n=1 Tax=Delitschia confertaspora ATCC 74209 TaxID=1513339 RepID=A0A9P4JLH1_9PLEO|nr:hypothetical protein GQ43DRAFT_119152 [Delitschia confertaspora ATCC 74209]
MAEAISIPSPSLFLGSSPDPNTRNTPVRRPPRRSHIQSSNPPLQHSESNGITKRKQSKSRNGCITCKAKRLKCDETKPSCQQCARRSVTCGGYKKDFKWRPFEEASFTGKASSAKNRKAAASSPVSTHVSSTGSTPKSVSQPLSSQESLQNAFMHPHGLLPSALHNPPMTSFEASYSPETDICVLPQHSSYTTAPHPLSSGDSFDQTLLDSNSVYEPSSADFRRTRTTAPSSISSGQSPRLVDLLLPETDLHAPPEEYVSYRAQYPESFYQPTSYTPANELVEDEDIEEIPRDFSSDHESLVIRLPSLSPSPSNSSSSSSESVYFPMLTLPQFPMNSPEMLTRRFDRDTCGILSVKDGPTENPWRTLIWPLARDCPALYYAIASMTSFHQSKDSAQLRMQGIAHMSTAIQILASGLENMRYEAAISTTLVLAFSESWDQHISTGINHIKGAKLLLDRELARHNLVPLRGEERTRLQFLCNTWIYMNVIARLTSSDNDQSDDFDAVSEMLCSNDEEYTELDPLMGCANTLFPIIGRVANLVHKVRNMDSNSPSIISQALQLKTQLETWVPPAHIEDPEDETTSPHDSERTAIAYQYATLLYLHQAVPEIPSLSSSELAKKVMCELATVEPRSRAIIVQIFPLMAAGSEAVAEDREWVRNRWEMMSARMKIGVIDRCADVTKEVWKRRDDAFQHATYQEDTLNEPFMPNRLKRDFSLMSEGVGDGDEFSWGDLGNKRLALSRPIAFDSPQPLTVKAEYGESRRRSISTTEALDPDLTVKGRLHWLGVMKDWGWEILLG